MKTYKLKKGDVIKISGIPFELKEDVDVQTATDGEIVRETSPQRTKFEVHTAGYPSRV